MMKMEEESEESELGVALAIAEEVTFRCFALGLGGEGRRREKN